MACRGWSVVGSNRLYSAGLSSLSAVSANIYLIFLIAEHRPVSPTPSAAHHPSLSCFAGIMWATRASSGTSSSSLNFAPMVRAGHCSRPHPPSRPHSHACTRACACTLSRQWHFHTRTQLCVHAYVHTDTSHLQGDEPHVFLPFIIQLACHSHVVVAYCCIGLSPSWKWHRWQCRCTANSLIMLLTQTRFPRLASRLFAPYPPLLLRSAGKMRYANNSQYKNDTMIRKEVRPLTLRPLTLRL